MTRWGILAPGSIAHRFAEGVQALSDAHIIAVGSRSADRAQAFAEKWRIRNVHGSYQSLVTDPDVDIVYVASPHPFHKEHSLLALAASKPVLCEKPFTINAAEAEELAAAARERKVFLMEGMWSRFFPGMAEIRMLIHAGAIGEVRIVQADFGFRGKYDPQGRLFNPDLGGGALLDVGIYTISFTSMLLGEPDKVTGVSTLCETGVDEQCAAVFHYPSGAVAVISTAVRTDTAWEARICGTEGRIAIHRPFWNPSRFTLSRPGKDDQEFEIPFESNGFNYEAAEAGRCLSEGRLESEIMPLDESISIMRTMDKLRAQWGIRYPSETDP